MARKSAAALAIVSNAPTPESGVPDGLSDAEAALWAQIVESKPAGWFDAGSAAVLKEYVRAVVACDRLQVLFAAAPDEVDGVNLLDRLLAMRDRESRRVANLATKLRLTQQSRYTPQAAATANKRASGKRPWQSG